MDGKNPCEDPWSRYTRDPMFFMCRTALHWACKRGHVDIVQHLLQNGADVNLLSCKSESVSDVTSDDRILKLLQASMYSDVILFVNVFIFSI